MIATEANRLAGIAVVLCATIARAARRARLTGR
jgi:hypothetical protein